MLKEFCSEFGRVIWLTKTIYLALFSLIVLGGFVVQQVEDLPPGEGFYFAMVTGLTIGYGDITPETMIGRLIALLLGFIGIILTGMMVATAVFSLREALEKLHPRNRDF